MSATDKELLHKVSQWISYGDEDLQLARHALTLKSGCPYRLIAYHAQQCAEKYLKAYCQECTAGARRFQVSIG